MVRIIAIVLIIMLLQWLFPFWGWIMIVPFLLSLTAMHTHRQTLLWCFTGGFLAWCIPAIYQYVTHAGLIVERMAETLHMGNPVVLLLITSILAGIFAAIAGIAGFSLRILFIKPKQKGRRKYY